MPNVSFIVKCTRSCNFACDYCTNRRNQSSILDFDQLVPFIKGTLSNPNYEQFIFIFHGGEPLLLGIDYYQKILILQELCKTKEQKIKNIIQTNGSLLDDDWITFLKTQSINVGISLDGPSEFQNRYRKYKDGRETFDDVIRGIQRLKNKDMSVGALSVLTDEVLSSNPYDYIKFYQDNGISNLGLLAERPSKKKNIKLNDTNDFIETRNRYASFMMNAYDNWINLDDCNFKIREFSDIMNSIIGGTPKVCIFNGSCVGHFFGIDISGEVAHCDKFFDDKRFCFGSISDNFLSDIVTSDTFLKAQKIEINIRNKCQLCEWFSICKGGCLYEAMTYENYGIKDRIRHCHLRKIFDHIYNNIWSELNRRDSLFKTEMV